MRFSTARIAVLALALVLLAAFPAAAQERHGGFTPPRPKIPIFNPGALKPVDSTLKVAVGDQAPDFTLPSIEGRDVSLSDYKGKSNVVLSFVPAAFTPVCSDQWPGYNIARELFEANNAALIGLSTDNTPSQWAWVQEMGGVWFPVLSDFWPHGKVAASFGVLRPNGVSERAVFIIDTAGVIRWIKVNDINTRPDLAEIVQALEAVAAGK
jgi:peroxiredoxin (alkyl hydroperoxide reductase subunit C)